MIQIKPPFIRSSWVHFWPFCPKYSKITMHEKPQKWQYLSKISDNHVEKCWTSLCIKGLFLCFPSYFDILMIFKDPKKNCQNPKKKKNDTDVRFLVVHKSTLLRKGQQNHFEENDRPNSVPHDQVLLFFTKQKTKKQKKAFWHFLLNNSRKSLDLHLTTSKKSQSKFGWLLRNCVFRILWNTVKFQRFLRFSIKCVKTRYFFWTRGILISGGVWIEKTTVWTERKWYK